MKYGAYTQISPERDVTDNAFSKGQINFRLNLDSMTRWNPYRSYMRMRISMTNENGGVLNHSSKIGPNMFQGDCFWQQMNMSCNGVRVSSIDDYYIQVAALNKRMVYEQSRRNTMLKDTNFGQASLKDRLAQVRQYGFSNGDANWKPFWTLHDTAGQFVEDDDELKITEVGGAGNPISIKYRSAGDGGDGAVDLLDSELEIGDYIKICDDSQADDAYTVRRISGIRESEIQVENDDLLAMAATAIEIPDSHGCLLYFSKNAESRRVMEYELIFRPALGFFQLDEFLPGNYQFELTPWKNGQYNTFSVEALPRLAVENPEYDATYRLAVKDVQLYAYTGIAKSPINGVKKYEFTETRCQAQTITNSTLMNKCFVVNKNAHMYTIAFQAGNAGTDISLSRAKFKMVNNAERGIRRYQLRCGGHTLPTPLPDIQKNGAEYTDYSTQQYYEELMYSRSAYLNDPESLTEWYERGPYYCYRMPKPALNPSNRLYVSVEFDSDRWEGQFLLLVFDTWYTGFSVVLDNGIVKSATRDTMIN
ncbi:MAG: hypothetical protein GY938_29475 [Ketobacter sp.]|nr:hypothetical protein [Ketobacter sp.]